MYCLSQYVCVVSVIPMWVKVFTPYIWFMSEVISMFCAVSQGSRLFTFLMLFLTVFLL